jgi:type II secretory pathway component HofQ
MFKKTVVLFLIMLFSVTGSYAQNNFSSMSPEEQTQPEDPEVSVTREGYVSLDFREADIRNVFKILSFKSGVNIVASPAVTGVVTIQLNDVPWMSFFPLMDTRQKRKEISFL